MITICQYVDQTEDTLDGSKASPRACSLLTSNKKPKLPQTTRPLSHSPHEVARVSPNFDLDQVLMKQKR